MGRGGRRRRRLGLALLAAALPAGVTSAVSWTAQRSLNEAVQVGTSTFLSTIVVILAAIQFVNNQCAGHGRAIPAPQPEREPQSPYETRRGTAA